MPVNVRDFGAAGDGLRLDTNALQAAIDACPAGRAVRLTRRGTPNIFLSGPLRLKAGVTLVIDAHTALTDHSLPGFAIIGGSYYPIDVVRHQHTV